MLEVVAVLARRRAALAPDRPLDVDEIDERAPGPQLHESYILLPALERAADHLAIEALEPRHVFRAQHDMVEAEDREGSGRGHGQSLFESAHSTIPPELTTEA